MDSIVRQWQNELWNYCWINQGVSDTVLFADNYAVIAKIRWPSAGNMCLIHCTRNTNWNIYCRTKSKFIFGIILCRFTSNEVSLLKLHKIMVVPTFLYMCENCTLLKQCEKGITTARWNWWGQLQDIHYTSIKVMHKSKN